MSDKKSILVASPYGFDIKTNTIYEVQEKYDSSAPDGFKEHRTSKLMSQGMEDEYSGAIWDLDKNIWDTGLHASSKVFRKAFIHVPESQHKDIIKNITQYIIKPLEKEIGTYKLDHVPTEITNEYWDNYKVKISRETKFNTENPKELLDLYFMLIFKKLTPIELESDPKFKQPISYYTVVDKEASLSKSAKFDSDRLDAIAEFGYLLKNKKEDLVAILEYLGLSAGKQTSNEVLIKMFNSWIEHKEDKYINIKQFNEAIKEYSEEAGKEKIYIYQKLKELKALDKVKVRQGTVYLDDIQIEKGFKKSAEKIYEDEELSETFASLVEKMNRK